MRTLNGFCFALLFSGAALAQNHAFVNSTPVLRGSFGNVLFPAGVPTNPGTRQVFPNVVFPPGTAPRLYVPNSTLAGAQFSAANRGRAGYGGNGYVGSGYARNGYRGRGNSTVAVPYAVPIYVGGYAGYTGYYDGGQPIDPGVLPSQPGQP
ncbi:MAG: hypothetical protein JO323_15165, partial [Acidobacteriia bacterium]|nr:hypothetical protein [Terriglobia bacterium]